MEKNIDQHLFDSVLKSESHADAIGYFDHDDLTFKACLLVAKYNGFDLNIKDRSYLTYKNNIDKIKSISESANAFLEKISLKDNWMSTTYQALVLFGEAEDDVFVFIPSFGGKGKVIDLKTGEKVLSVNMSIIVTAYQIHGGFKIKQNQTTVTWRSLFSKSLSHNYRSLLFILLISIAVSVLGWVTPIFISHLISKSIPTNRVVDFIQLPMIMLVLLAVIFILLQIKNSVITKIIIHSASNLQKSIFHRALFLPLSYYNKKSAGSSAITILMLLRISQQLAAGQAEAIFSTIVAFISVFMMFYYLPMMATIVVSLLGLYFFSLVVLSLLRLKIYFDSIRMFQSTTSFLFQLCRGLSKIKATASENIMLTKWFKRYVILERVMFKVHGMNIIEDIFKSGINITLLSIIFLSIIILQPEKISLGSYIGFTVAYGQFFVGICSMANLVNEVLQNVSTLRMIKPFLNAPTELDLTADLKKWELTGSISAHDVNFTYPNTDQPVLKKINFAVSPGEMVSIVGPSGCGKSTLLAILLGFEKPQSGCVMYDGQPLSELNLRALRNQFGVVLQGSKLVSGSIKENIIGHHSAMSEEELWRIAKAACILDDIQKMPMGFHTMVSALDGQVSGGQVQRILIAKALAKKPKILFLDEATSALDSITQAQVMKNIESLGITRIVLAHRLSTIKQADKILVLQDGAVVESGDFNSLIELKGLFFNLIRHEGINNS